MTGLLCRPFQSNSGYQEEEPNISTDWWQFVKNLFPILSGIYIMQNTMVRGGGGEWLAEGKK